MCVKFHLDWCICLWFMAKMQSVRNDDEEKKWRHFVHLYLEIGWHELLPIWHVESPTLGDLRCKKDVFFLSSCQYTHGVARRLLGPHNILSCVLIYIINASLLMTLYNIRKYHRLVTCIYAIFTNVGSTWLLIKFTIPKYYVLQVTKSWTTFLS